MNRSQLFNVFCQLQAGDLVDGQIGGAGNPYLKSNCLFQLTFVGDAGSGNAVLITFAKTTC
jgi:hypothetical protein